MKSTRRLLSIILCLIMCLSLLPATAFADSNIMTSGWAGSTVQFKLYTDGKLVLNGTGNILDMEHWSFSSSYSFADDAVKATRSETKTLVVEQGIKQIMNGVFANCPNLTAVSLPNSLDYIGEGAFQNCQGLTKITIPGNVTLIDSSAFMGCTSLSSVTLSTGLATIGQQAFEDCTSLSSIVIPANVTKILANAFKNSGLKTVTFKGNYVGGMIDASAFTNVVADVYYPVDNNTWNDLVNPMNTFKDFSGRLTWAPSSAQTQTEGWVKKTVGGKDAWYYYVGGKMLINSWKAFGGEWFYFGSDGVMLQGRQKVGNDYYYFGVDGKDAKVGGRLSGYHDGYYYGEDGKWNPSYSGVDDTGLDYYRNGWQKVNGKWFYIRNQAKVTGWLLSYGYWYYLDPTTGAMVTGWLTWNGKTYYLRPLDKAVADGLPDREGSMIAGCSSTIGGKVYTFDDSGALIGGKMDENPMGYENGWRKEGPNWVFYRSDGKKATGWELVDKNWYFFNGSGVMQRGWYYDGSSWYYLTKWVKSGSSWVEVTDPTSTDAGKMVTGFQTIPYTKSDGAYSPKTYFFKSWGALNGKGWIQVGLKWYYLEEDGVVATGWFRDGTKWYYLRDDTDPIGEMVTGVFTVPATLKSGKANSPSGKQSFKANGEWTGDGDKTATGGAVKAGSWKEHDGGWYYHDANGVAVTGWQEIDGKWYYLNPSSSPAGKMFTGWHDIDGYTYYFENSGAMLGGWQKIDGVWYYLYPDHDGKFGRLLKGWQLSNGRWYYLDDTTGALQDGWYEVKAGSKGEAQGFAKGWYYLNPDKGSDTYGAMQEGGWKLIDGKWYFFHCEHDGAYGRLEQGKWISHKGNWYYVKASSNPAESWMVTGLQTIGSDKYYFDGDGVMQTGWEEIGGKWYYFHEAADGNQGRAHTNSFGGDVDGWGFNADGTAYQK